MGVPASSAADEPAMTPAALPAASPADGERLRPPLHLGRCKGPPLEPSPAGKWTYLRPTPSDEDAEWPKLKPSPSSIVLAPPRGDWTTFCQSTQLGRGLRRRFARRDARWNGAGEEATTQPRRQYQQLDHSWKRTL